MNKYNTNLSYNEIKILTKWTRHNEWSDIKRHIHKITTNRKNKKYITKFNDSYIELNSIILKLMIQMEPNNFIEYIKNLNKTHYGGDYSNIYNLNGGINFGKLVSSVKQKATTLGKQAQEQIKKQGKELADKATIYAQEQANIAQQQLKEHVKYAQEQGEKLLDDANIYAQQQVAQAQEEFKTQGKKVIDDASTYARQQGKQIVDNVNLYTQQKTDLVKTELKKQGKKVKENIKKQGKQLVDSANLYIPQQIKQVQENLGYITIPEGFSPTFPSQKTIEPIENTVNSTAQQNMTETTEINSSVNPVNPINPVNPADLTNKPSGLLETISDSFADVGGKLIGF